jgi:hypothetical protein
MTRADAIASRPAAHRARAALSSSYTERAVRDSGFDQDLAAIGELDCASDQIEQELPEALLVAAASGQVSRHDRSPPSLRVAARKHRGPKTPRKGISLPVPPKKHVVVVDPGDGRASLYCDALRSEGERG